MSWLQGFFGRFGLSSEARSVADNQQTPASTFLGGLPTGGRIINARVAENLSAVLACVNVVASSIASLPAYLYRHTEKGREEDIDHPLARLIQTGPNERQTWPDFVEWLMASTLLRGNGLAEIVSDGRGNVTQLVPIPWDYVSVQLLSSGRLAYDIVEQIGFAGTTGRPRRLLEGEVLHLRDRSDDGYIGRSRLSRAAAVVSNALSINEFAGNLYDNGINPSGALELEKPMPAPAKAEIRDQLTKGFAGPSKTGKFLILDQGLKWKPISITPEDAELLGSRKFTVEELVRLYGVPPPLVQIYDHNTFTNAESAGRWFAQFTLQPWIRKLETEFCRSVFSQADRSTHEVVIDLSGFQRGDYAARWAAHKIAVDAEILTVNEVREIEGWNQREGGDTFKQAKVSVG